MSEQEKKMAEVIRDGFPKLTEFDKGYFLAKNRGSSRAGEPAEGGEA